MKTENTASKYIEELNETVFGVPQPEDDIVEQIDEAVREFWNANLVPVSVVWVDTETWDRHGKYNAHQLFWNRWGTRVIFLDEFFKNKEKKFFIK